MCFLVGAVRNVSNPAMLMVRSFGDTEDFVDQFVCAFHAGRPSCQEWPAVLAEFSPIERP